MFVPVSAGRAEDIDRRRDATSLRAEVRASLHRPVESAVESRTRARRRLGSAAGSASTAASARLCGLVSALARSPRPRPRRPRPRRLAAALGCRLGLRFLGRSAAPRRRLGSGSSLGRQLAALGNDQRRTVDGHVGEELDGDLVAADPLDRVGQVDLAAVDADPCAFPELVGDVGRGHRAEERPGRARPSSRTAARRPPSVCAISCACSTAAPRGAPAAAVALLELGQTRRPWPPRPAAAGAGSCARTRARRRRPRRAGRPSRRPGGG